MLLIARWTSMHLKKKYWQIEKYPKGYFFMILPRMNKFGRGFWHSYYNGLSGGVKYLDK